MRIAALVLAACFLGGCAYKPLAGPALDEVRQPAFISRIEEQAGPRSQVFRDDSAWAPKLKQLQPKEADRRLASKLQKAMSRFEIAERLRATTANRLPSERPWTETVDPARVAATLQSFLVDEVPANPPDYNLLQELGADAVVEFVIEEYGMKSRDGKSGLYILGYGRMFRLGGDELWRRNFKVDELESGTANLDPFAVAKDPQLWRQAMGRALDAVAYQFATDLTPSDRGTGAPPTSAPRAPESSESPAPGADELDGGGDVVKPRQEQREAPPIEEDPL